MQDWQADNYKARMASSLKARVVAEFHVSHASQIGYTVRGGAVAARLFV
jgi:hypothetical protein